MIDQTPGDLHRDSMNGAGRHEIVETTPVILEDAQTLSDGDDTLADADQTQSDSDQTAADSDQQAADNDQAASDRDLVQGGDREVHYSSRQVRHRSTQQREHSSKGRVEAADGRDAAAHARDLAAMVRDRDADLHDRGLAASGGSQPVDRLAGKGAELLRSAAENRTSAAGDRLAAAEGRARAAADRELAAHDREHAASDRAQALADRAALRAELAVAETDQLTGARTRAAGLVDLDHEIDRARRTTGILAIAYVDIVGLKAANDTYGHAAGDALLQHAVSGIRDHLRSYDLIVRLGGDEFLCVMPGSTIENLRERFVAVQTALATDDRCTIKIGCAALTATDTATQLIARADAELPTSPGR
jgi:diguanylate cyclase (GGDEF)-like protein